MKKIIFSIVIAVLATGLFSYAPSVLAAASFNNDPADLPTLRVGNSTAQANTLNWASSVSANTGDIIGFLVYYHNTSNETANQTRIRAFLPSGVFNSASVTASVFASNASAINGQSTVNLTSSQTLTFIPGTVKWYPNRASSNPQSFPSGQNGNEIVSANGLNIGDISSGWGTQGYLTFQAQVSSSNVPPGGGSQTLAPSVTTLPAYNIGQTSATLSGNVNPNNSNTNVWFEYGLSQSLGSQTSAQSVGGGNSSSNISAPLNGLQQNTTYYFRAAAQNSIGTSFGSIFSFTTGASSQQPQSSSGQSPIVTTNSATNIVQNNATLNASVNSNSSNTTVWFEYGNSYALGNTTGYQTVGSANYTNNVSAYLFGLAPNSVYYFRAVAQNQYGTTYGNILTFTTNYNIQTAGLPSVVTSYASSITQSSATLNGSVNSNNDYATAWFEWGKTLSLGNITYSQGVNQSIGSFQTSSYLSGLQGGTVYYFRAVGQNSYGTAYGDIYNFTTQGASGGYVLPAYTSPQQIIQPAITYRTTVETGKVSLVALTPTISNLNPKSGEEITFTIVYRNEGSTDIKNALLRILLPLEVDYVASSREPFYSVNDLEYNLGTIRAYEQGNISVKVKVKDLVKEGTNLVFNSILDYTDGNNKQQQVNVYLTVLTAGANRGFLLGASLIGLLGYLFNNWLFNLLLIIAVLIAAYYFYRLFLKSKKGADENDAPVVS